MAQSRLLTISKEGDGLERLINNLVMGVLGAENTEKGMWDVTKRHKCQQHWLRFFPFTKTLKLRDIKPST